jgi:hypothetical protein
LQAHLLTDAAAAFPFFGKEKNFDKLSATRFAGRVYRSMP